jgi:hypothetical protein
MTVFGDGAGFGRKRVESYKNMSGLPSSLLSPDEDEVTRQLATN